MVTTEQLEDWYKRLERISLYPEDIFNSTDLDDVSDEIKQAWLDAVRREANA